MRRSDLLLVAAGGFLGTLGRYAVSRTVPEQSAFPLATFIVNVAGAFALGVVIERLATVADPVRSRRVRLLVGTGMLGSFTTYSTFAVDTERLLADGAGDVAAAYVAVSLAAGLVACAIGVVSASWWARRRTEA